MLVKKLCISGEMPEVLSASSVSMRLICVPLVASAAEADCAAGQLRRQVAVVAARHGRHVGARADEARAAGDGAAGGDLGHLAAVAGGVHVGGVVGRGHQRGAGDAEAAQTRVEQTSGHGALPVLSNGCRGAGIARGDALVYIGSAAET
jgi:hypothetical protein